LEFNEVRNFLPWILENHVPPFSATPQPRSQDRFELYACFASRSPA
jgi:hypothetical protein